MKQGTILLVTATLFLTTFMTSCGTGKGEGCYYGNVEQRVEQKESIRVKDKCPDYVVHSKEEVAD